MKPFSGYKSCLVCGKVFPYRESLKIRGYNGIGYVNQKYCSKECVKTFTRERNKTQEMREKSRLSGLKNKGKRRKETLETRTKKSLRWRGEKSHFWKGGKTKESSLVRESFQYDIWRLSVFKRDNYTCQICGERSRAGHRVFLNADHIKPFALFPELRFDISNGRTLCVGCHRKTDTFGWRLLNNIKNKNNSLSKGRVH